MSTTQAAFTYYDANGALMTPPLTGTTFASVDSIDVVEGPGRDGHPRDPHRARVTLPNADVVAGSDGEPMTTRTTRGNTMTSS